MSNNHWSTPFSDYDVMQYWADMRLKLGPGAIVEEKPLKYAFLLGTDATDFGSASTPLILDVLDRAGERATAAGPTDSSAANSGMIGWETTRPQEPKLDKDGLVPVGTSILIGGIGVVVLVPLVVARGFVAPASDPAGTYSVAAAADDALAGIQAAFDCCVVQLSDARNQKAEVSGHQAVSYGASRVAVYGPPVASTLEDDTTTVDSMLYSGQVASKDRGWAKISPVYFDGGAAGVSASQLGLSMIIPRSTAWPVLTGTRFRVEVILPALIGYQGGAGRIECDPQTGRPIGRGLAPPPRYVPGKGRE